MTTACLDEFRAPANSLAHWQMTAEMLVSAAETLKFVAGDRREAPWGTLWPELMLWGCAIETFLKALRLKQAIESRDAERLLYRNGRLNAPANHNLVKLAEWASFPVSSFQKKVLQELSKAVRYGGRYPIPFDGELASYWWYGQESDDEVKSIIAALRSRLPKDPSVYQKRQLEDAE